ncbi:MAG: sugar phosphate isomerase/epimerase [Caldilineaceae bacterium]|nr:sugar phosphate isomerase/epimerase [Caldilineaceae bacterium]
MKLGLLGWIVSDLQDVTYDMVRGVAELGFHGMGAHLTVPAATIPEATATTAARAVADVGLELLQLWGPYPCIISPDETVRRAGVQGARDLVKLAARMKIPASGVRPTSLNPRGDWWPHAHNYTPETEERFLRSLMEILETAHEYGIEIVLETHVTTVLNSPERIKRIIETTGSDLLKLNLDPVNFMGDLPTAFHPAPTLHKIFDLLGDYTATVHVKDFYVEDRLVVHISETIPGTGIMDLDTVLKRTQALSPDMYAIIEHLPISQIALAKQNLTQRIRELGIPLG